MKRFSFYLQLVGTFISAGKILYRSGANNLRLEPVNERTHVPNDSIVQIVKRIDKATKWIAPFTRHSCFYRAYAMANILRKKGLPVSFNIGLRNLSPADATRGHCWLSLNGQPFYEKNLDAVAIYADVLMGKTTQDICYWINSDPAHQVMRARRNAPVMN